MKIAMKMGSSWPGGNSTEVARETVKLKGWGIIVSIFEMDQN